MPKIEFRVAAIEPWVVRIEKAVDKVAVIDRDVLISVLAGDALAASLKEC